MKKLLLLLSLFLVSVETFAGIPLSTNFTVNTALPIEDRMSVADVTARDALSSLRRWEGMLVYVVADGKHYTLIGGITNGDWTELSGGGGGNLALWVTANPYVIGDTVIESNKIYYALTNHTSGTFATDLANNEWIQLGNDVSTSTGVLPVANGGTGSATQNFVDLTTTQTVAGAKTFSNDLTVNANISAYNYDKDNMLVNGNIENPLSTEWTCTVGTCSRTTATGEFSKDTAALKVVLSAQAMNVSQTITTPTGIQKQGFARAIYRVPATMADFQICTLVDAAEQTCVPTANLIKDDTFRSIEIPLTFGTTSAGIKFKTTSAYTANAYFDGAIVAQGLGLQNLQGDAIYSAEVTASTGTIVKQEIGSMSLIASCTAASPSVCTFTTGRFTIKPYCWASFGNNAGANEPGVSAFANVTSATSVSIGAINTGTGGYITGRTLTLTCQKSGNDYLASSANVYSQASANYSRRAYTPTFTGFGTVTGIDCYESRDGGINEIDCKFTSGTPTAVNGTVTLPTGLTSANTATINGGSVSTSIVNANILNVILLASTNTAITFGVNSAGAAGLTPLVANSWASNGSVISFKVRVPISGWSNSNVIVGSFENVPVTPGIARPVLFSANITTTSGTITDNKGGIFTTCTAANPTICSHPGLISTPNCTMSADNTSSGEAQATWTAATTNSTQISIYTTNGSGSALANTKVKIICHGEK